MGSYFVDPFLLFGFRVCLCHTVLSVPCGLVITCCERADLLSLWRMMFSCVLSRPGLGVVLDCNDS